MIKKNTGISGVLFFIACARKKPAHEAFKQHEQDSIHFSSSTDNRAVFIFQAARTGQYSFL
jgi:hypothetical protein